MLKIKNVEEVRRKKQTYFFFKVLTWPTSLKVLNLDLECTKNDLFEQRIIISSSRVICKFILHVIQGCFGYMVPGLRPSYLALKEFQQAQPPPI